MSSRLRHISALLGIFLATPLIAQAPALKSAGTVATFATLTPVRADTAVMMVVVSSKQGELQGKLRQLLKGEIVKAKALGRTVFLELGATWCGSCKALEESMKHDKDIIDAFSGAYLVHLDLNEWDIEEELGYRVQGGIPKVLALNESGKVLGESNGSYKEYVQAHLWKKPINKLAAK